MEGKKSKTDLIFDALAYSQEKGDKTELDEHYEDKKKLVFANLDVDSIKPRKTQVEYSSVKIRTELYQQIRKAAEKQGIRQPGKFISLILEAYLSQIKR